MMSDLSSTESGLLTLRNLNISPTTSSFSAQNSPDEFVHSPLEDAEHAIRLLDLEPSSDATLDIRCNVRHVILDTDDNTLQYKTLSYTWGDPNDTKAIFVDGKQYRVTLNCHAALRRLRELGERSLWMVCILSLCYIHMFLGRGEVGRPFSDASLRFTRLSYTFLQRVKSFSYKILIQS